MRLTTRDRLLASEPDCEHWAALPETATAAALDLPGTDTYELDLHGPDGEPGSTTFERAADLLFAYRMFPAERLVARLCSESGWVEEGATIVQRIFLGSLAVESGVRITEVFDEPIWSGRRIGFIYVTLHGHPERGAASYALLLHDDDRLQLIVTANGRPAAVLARLAGPITRLLQVRATREALRHYRGLVRGTPAEFPIAVGDDGWTAPEAEPPQG